jgi:hypothetical protein
MQVAASVTYGCRAMVGYVDTCHSFSATRLSHMLGGLVARRDASQVRCTHPFCDGVFFVKYRCLAYHGLCEDAELGEFPMEETLTFWCCVMGLAAGRSCR